MKYIKNIEEALPLIHNNKGINLVKECGAKNTDGYIADIICRLTEEITDDDGDVIDEKTTTYTYAALIYPGMAGTLSVLATDNKSVWLADIDDLCMPIVSDLINYMNLFNRANAGGSDTTFKITEIVRFSCF